MPQLISSDLHGEQTVIASGNAVEIRREFTDMFTNLVGKKHWSMHADKSGWPRVVVAPPSGCAPRHYFVKETS